MSAHEQTMDGPIGPPHVHHMDSTTAYKAAKLGMWLFLATEILLFGVLFTAFAIFRWMYLEEFQYAATKLDWRFGGFNTLVLIFSSFTAALAVDAAQHGDNAKVRRNIIITIACAAIFLVIKYIEYSGKAAHGIFPFLSDCTQHGDHLCWNSPEFTEKYKMYFGLYYCMTGLHALHVVIGMGLLGWVYSLARKNRFSSDYYTPVEVGALYWHLVDLIWIYLFPLLYLVE